MHLLTYLLTCLLVMAQLWRTFRTRWLCGSRPWNLKRRKTLASCWAELSSAVQPTSRSVGRTLQGPLNCCKQKNWCSKNVFKWRLKDCNVGAETMCSGREFLIWAAATGIARLPTVDCLTDSSTSRLVPVERSARRPGTSAVEVNSPRCRGASPWRTLYVSTAILNWIRSGTRSQCRLVCK